MNMPLLRGADPLAHDSTRWRRALAAADDRLPRNADGGLFRFPQLRWGFNHARELGPTKIVRRGAGPIASLERRPRDLQALDFITTDGEELTFGESLARTCADGFIVLHKGQVVHETYSGEGAAHRPHICMSVTKSLVGTVAATLVHEGALDPDALVPHYVPELSQGAYGDTAWQVLDMLIGVEYREDYTDPGAEIWDYARAGALFPRGPTYEGPRDFRSYLAGLRKQGEHGRGFDYKTINTEVLGWILANVAGGALRRSRFGANLVADRPGRRLLHNNCGLNCTT